MKLKISILAVFLACNFLNPIQATEPDHVHAEWELGVSLSRVELKEDGEKETAPAVHLHLMKRLEGEEFLDRLAVGLGFETIFADHDHHALMASIAYFPIESLFLSVSPGWAFVKEDGEWEDFYMTHFEAGYGFHFDEIEIGPVLGFADSKHGDHWMVGIHLGFGL